MFSKNESESSDSLAILSCLCHDNYFVGKSFLTNLTTEERTKLYARNHGDARSKLCLDHLLTSLNRRHFLNQPPKFENLSQNLSLLSTAFAAAYPENDLLVMRISIDFLEDLLISSTEHSSKDNVKEVVLSIIKQMFVMMDFGDVSDEQNSLLFNFASHLSKLHGYSLNFLDITVKTVLYLLEANTNATNTMFEAIEMLSQVLKKAALDKEKDQTLMSSLKLQLDSLLALFNATLTTDIKLEDDKASLKLVEAVLRCSLCLTKFNLIGAQFGNPTLIVAKLKSVLNSDRLCGGPIMAILFEMASKLKTDNKKWEKVFREKLETDESLIRSWMNCFESKCHKSWVGNYFRLMDENSETSRVFQKLWAEEGTDPKTKIDDPPRKKDTFANFDMKEIDKVVQQISTKIQNNDTNDCLLEVWEMGQFQVETQKNKINILNEALKAADVSLIGTVHFFFDVFSQSIFILCRIKSYNTKATLVFWSQRTVD